MSRHGGLRLRMLLQQVCRRRRRLRWPLLCLRRSLPIATRPAVMPIRACSRMASSVDPPWHSNYSACPGTPSSAAGEDGEWMRDQQILRRPCRSWRDKGGGYGYRLFLGGLAPDLEHRDVERWIRAAGGESRHRPMIEYPGVTAKTPSKNCLRYLFVLCVYCLLYVFTSLGTWT